MSLNLPIDTGHQGRRLPSVTSILGAGHLYVKFHMKSSLIGLIVLVFAGPAYANAKAVVPVREEQKFIDVRIELLRVGWKPRKTSIRMADGMLEREFASAKSFLQKGFLEVESCSGTGANWCIFNYVNSEKKCLRIQTTGEYPEGAIIRDWSFECPPKDAL